MKNKIVWVNIPGVGEAPLERRDGALRASAEWFARAMNSTERPEGYEEADVTLNLSVRDMHLLFDGVTLRTEIVDRGTPPEV